MNCPACGTEVEKNAVYCPKCGERVDMQEEALLPGGEEQAPTQEAPPEQAAPPETAPAPDTSPPKTPAQVMRDSLQDRKEADDDEEERELWTGRYSRRTLIGTWLLCSLVTVLALVAGAMWVRNGTVWIILLVILLIIWGYPGLLLTYRRMSIRYRLTTQRFFHEKGILRHITDRIEVIDIDDITYDQTILQRMVNVGTIHVTSSDRSHPVLDVLGIENVQEVATMMDGARRKERVRRGLHIEAV
jgi:membrane protein YdbS with pleckstrin-like domain